MAGGSLCPRHRPHPPQDPQGLIQVLEECCSQKPAFLPPKLPLLESVFRLLLARGNEPLSAGELAQELTQRRGQKVDEELLSGLLRAEPRYYGVRPVAEEEAKEPGTSDK